MKSVRRIFAWAAHIVHGYTHICACVYFLGQWSQRLTKQKHTAERARSRKMLGCFFLLLLSSAIWIFSWNIVRLRKMPVERKRGEKPLRQLIHNDDNGKNEAVQVKTEPENKRIRVKKSSVRFQRIYTHTSCTHQQNTTQGAMSKSERRTFATCALKTKTIRAIVAYTPSANGYMAVCALLHMLGACSLLISFLHFFLFCSNFVQVDVCSLYIIGVIFVVSELVLCAHEKEATKTSRKIKRKKKCSSQLTTQAATMSTLRVLQNERLNNSKNNNRNNEEKQHITLGACFCLCRTQNRPRARLRCW